MECYLDKEKIKKGIENSVIERVAANSLLKLEDDNIVRLLSQKVPLTPEQKEKVLDSLQYASDIKGAYKYSFELDPETFLREIAQQANSSVSEKGTALSVAGPNLFEAATTIFPEEGLLKEEVKHIEAINNAFTEPVLVPISRGTYKIDIPNILVTKYLMRQTGSKEQVLEELRAHYLSQYTDQSLNMMQEHLWLKHPILQDVNVQRLLEFARKINPNFIVSEVEGLDQRAVSLIRDHIILIGSGNMIDELPEEVSHFFVELLPDDNPLKISLLKEVLNHPIYSQTLKEYGNNPAYQKDGKINYDKIKREAAAKLIGDYIKASWDNNTSKYGEKKSFLKNLIGKIIKFLRKHFVQSVTSYTEPLNSLNSPFAEAADKIMKGDITSLNIQKIPTIYDSFFFSKVEEHVDEFEYSDIAKSMFNLAKSTARSIHKDFNKKIQSEDMKGLKELLNDPVHASYSKVYDITELLRDSMFKDALPDAASAEERKSWEMSRINDAAIRLGEAYREMEMIPVAMSKAINAMKVEGNEKLLINNIRELQQYFRFADVFKNITENYIKTIEFVKNNHTDGGLDNNAIYTRMANGIGETQVKFQIVDNEIMRMLKEHTLGLMAVWTFDKFTTYSKELQGIYGVAETTRLKATIERMLKEKFTDVDQLRQAIMGQFPSEHQLRSIDGKKIDIGRIKDISQIDYLITLLSGSSLTGDVFVNELMAFYADKYIEGVYNGARQAKVFADSIIPIKVEMAKLGVGYYEAERMIQQVEEFWDPALEDNKTEKRTLLSETDRHTFNFQKQVRKAAWEAKLSEMGRLQAPLLFEKRTPEQLKEVSDKIKIVQAEANQLKKDYDQFIKDYSYQRYTEEYYKIKDAIEPKEEDSRVLAEIKDISARILQQEQIQYIVIAQDSLINEPFYEDATEKIAELQAKKMELSLLLPEREKSIFETMEKLYEVDQIGTERLRTRHKRRWITGNLRTKLANPLNTKTEAQITKELEGLYETLYTIRRPNTEFYERRSAIFQEITELTGKDEELSFMATRMEELEKERQAILKNFRNIRVEVSVTSMKYNLDIANKLKDIEEEVDDIRKKMSIFSNIDIPSEQARVQIKTYVEMLMKFAQIAKDPFMKRDKIISTLLSLIELTDSQADQILNALEQSRNGDHTALNNLGSMNPTFKNSAAQYAWAIMRFENLTTATIKNTSDKVADLFKLGKTTDPELRDAISDKFAQLNALYTKSVSFDYILVMREFFQYFEEYLESDFDEELKTLHQEKYNEFNAAEFYTYEAVENFLGDDVMEATLRYLNHKSQRPEVDEKESAAIDRYTSFMLAIHKQKTIRVDDDYITTWSPMQYINRPITDDNLTTVTSPRFLTRNKVRDEFVVEQVNELDQRVIDGTMKANVDINGEWLPRPDVTSPFYNKRYEKLKNSKDQKDILAFQLLNTIKKQYLEKQVATLNEGERLDTVMPAKGTDKFEQKKVLLTNAKDALAWVQNNIPFIGQRQVQEEDVNLKEEIGAITVENRDIYTGAILADKGVKLSARRRIPIQRQTEDATAAVTMFFEEVNIYEAKNYVAPIVKTFSDVFEHAHNTNPTGNKLRSEVIRDFEMTKIYDEIPKNFANNPHLAKVLAIVSKTINFRLMGDLLGATVNVTTGVINNLIEQSVSKEEYANFLKAGHIASKWLIKYDQDFYKRATWSKETQIISMFNFIPDRLKISHQLSYHSIAANVQSKLMAPRTEGEKFLGIQLGMGILLSHPVTITNNDGTQSKIAVHDLYDLDPTTNLLRVKPEYSSLDEQWNPENGTEVTKIRRMIMQKYTLIQGNFFEFNQSYISYTAIGKAAELLKRWAASGIIRRYQGEVLDPFTGEPRKGYHLAMLHLLRELLATIGTGSFDNFRDYWTHMASRPSEKAALRRSSAELLYILVFGLLVSMVLGYSDSDDDKNKKLKEMNWWKQAALLMAIRVQGELGTFIPVPVFGLGYTEMKRMILEPLAITVGGFNNIAAIGNLAVSQMLYSWAGQDQLEKKLYYQKDQGYDSDLNRFIGFKGKGDSKLWAIILNTVGYTGYTADPEPYIKVINTMQNRVK